MTLLEFIRQHLTLALISELIEHRTPVRSMIFDRVFTRRENRATARISLAGNVLLTAISSAPSGARPALARALAISFFTSLYCSIR